MAKNQIVMDALEAFNKWYLGRVHDDDREESLRAFLAGFQACAALRPIPHETDVLHNADLEDRHRPDSPFDSYP